MLLLRAPLQSQMFPRLELLSAFLLSKLVVTIHNTFQPKMTTLDVRCYTDSEVTLYWIRGKDKEWKPFVQNSVREIQCNVHPDLQNHFPRKCNPADPPSRGLNILELFVSQLWREGPKWLNLDAPIYSDIESSPIPELCLPELKTNTKLSHNQLAIEKSWRCDVLWRLQLPSNVTQSHCIHSESSEPHQGQREVWLKSSNHIDSSRNRNFGSLMHRSSWSSRRVLKPWYINLAYSSMTKDSGDVAASYRMPTFPLLPSIQFCCPEGIP